MAYVLFEVGGTGGGVTMPLGEFLLLRLEVLWSGHVSYATVCRLEESLPLCLAAL